MDAPPILKNIEDHLLEYLTTPENLPIHNYERNQEFWPRVPNPKNLFEYDNSPLATTLQVERDLNTGEIIQFHEVLIQGAGNTARNSMQLTRAPTLLPDETLKGSISNYPFWPGGFPDPIKELDTHENIKLTNDLLTIPPGFTRGLLFDKDGLTVKTSGDTENEHNEVQSENIVNLIDVMEDHDFLGIWETSQQIKYEETSLTTANINLPEEDEVIPKELPVLNITKPTKLLNEQGTEWAILLDTTKPVTDFKERVPHMAIEYEFELDTFQKLAILQLEKHNHVFVAAHTSAGKTVVAEYAIALSQRHLTRTIYTSPIKALSNQKYRDFKHKFKDVGLVTGDFQINIKASCLIMTTEILRSMLFGGSEVTRDLEYVIFDEVHYINDKERGHVWEQVLIMLPEHVCVVLLSATVPNTIEFADWLGRTYKKKVYVVSTYKRPVPLEHYLYTGTGGSSRDNRFLILDADGRFSLEGYAKAQNSLKTLKEQKAEKDPKAKKPTQYNPTNRTNYTDFKAVRTMWDGLVAHLLKSNSEQDGLLPVVAFTFSRQKCDNYAELLKHLDLTTKDEKFEIETFFDKCIKSLKPPDREVPQIVKMREILNKGIGVHHSGILPIVKEMIEMLFQKRLVKLLFATETFAMGVNMPARTVVFDSITKHDGSELRNLKPAEYIQMAGRAGRRGKDKTGTVIMLCKGVLPPVASLKEMMLGKPSQLRSQFRITYGMVLSLLRVERLSVEGIISRSFREADHQKNQENIRKQLENVERDLSIECTKELSEYMQPLIRFYEAASAYLLARNDLWLNIMQSPKIIKELTPGRVVLITHGSHMNKLAVILNAVFKPHNHTYKVLVLCDKETSSLDKSDTWFKMISFSKSQIFCPEGITEHKVLIIGAVDIFEITSKVIKVDTDLVLKDWEKRQIERFRNDPPGQTFNLAIQELYNVSLNFLNKDEPHHNYLDFIHDLKLNQFEVHKQKVYLNELKDKLLDYVTSTQIPNFEEQFTIVFDKKSLEDKMNNLKFQLSYASLSLYPELEKRVQLLQELNYVDHKNRVELKGKVACEMGSNELLITELVVRNELANFQPAEIAALLSSLVFQAKTRVEPQLTKELKEGIKVIMKIFDDITAKEQTFGVDKISEVSKEPNFGLVEVVYEWARAKPFAEIMQLTDIQEGIIVRCIQQLNETICDVRNAARITGDSKFQSKMEEASAAIKRDIVFAESLYTTNETF